MAQLGWGTEKDWNKMPAVAEVLTRVSGVQRVATADSAGLPRMNRSYPAKKERMATGWHG